MCRRDSEPSSSLPPSLLCHANQKVGEVKLPLYERDSRNPYVRHRSLRYPKAGTANPEVSLRVVDLQVKNPLHTRTSRSSKDPLPVRRYFNKGLRKWQEVAAAGARSHDPLKWLASMKIRQTRVFT